MITQRELVVKYIHDFGSISSWDAFKDLGITRLSAKIWELKRDGYIISKERKTARNRYGKAIWYDRYTIAGEMGVKNE